MRFRFGGGSDVGMQRHNNQDSMYAGSRLIAVADGVGGAAGGEVASSVTITALSALDTQPATDPQAALRSAAEAADAAIRDTVARDGSLAGMSTTLTAILATDTDLTLAHIGDSRAYRLRDGVLEQLTHDHTLVQSLIDEGQITETEALTHPRRSWILRALDGRGTPELDLTTLDLEPGDRLLVCSDGLSSYVDEAEIAAELAGGEPQVAADRLINLALRAGGPDNITCVVADPIDGEVEAQPPILAGAVTDPPRPAAPTEVVPTDDPLAVETAPRRRSIGRRLALVACLVVIVVAGTIAGVAVYIHHQWYVASADGKVALYQGVHGNAAGVKLSHEKGLTNLPVTALPQDDRAQVAKGIQASGGLAGANRIVDNLRADACALATATPTPVITPTNTPATHQATSKHQGKHGKHHKHHHRTPTPPVPVYCAPSGVRQ